MGFTKLMNVIFFLGFCVALTEAEGPQQYSSSWDVEGEGGSWNGEGSDVQNWSPEYSRVHDGVNQNDFRHDRDPGPEDGSVKWWNGDVQGWSSGDAQTKEAELWNKQPSGEGWSPNDLQVKRIINEENQVSIDNFTPSSAQGKYYNSWHPEVNQQDKINFGPSDTQVKDQGTWNNLRNSQYPGNFGQSDVQSKDSNRWNDSENQKIPEQFHPADTQEKVFSSGESGRSGNWSPADAQDAGKTARESWGPGESQMKIDGALNKGDPSENWGKNPGSNSSWNSNNGGNKDWGIGPQEKGGYKSNGRTGPGSGDWSTHQGDGPSVGHGQTTSRDWSINELPEHGGIGSPNGQSGTETSIGQGGIEPSIEPNQGGDNTARRDGPTDGRWSFDLPGNEDGGDRSTEGNRGDVGISPGLFPPRILQGNYKGGDTNAHPGDNPREWRLEDSIPGTPGVDYPNYSTIPPTGFDCKQYQNPGYYGDVETQCQVFHICQSDGRRDAFLCPLGTIFNQKYFVCVWWFNFNCAETEMYYDMNADLYKGGHGAQRNFKGDPYKEPGDPATRYPNEGGRGHTETSENTTPTDPAILMGDTGRSYPGTRPVITVDQQFSGVPPGTGAQSGRVDGQVVIPVERQRGGWSSEDQLGVQQAGLPDVGVQSNSFHEGYVAGEGDSMSTDIDFSKRPGNQVASKAGQGSYFDQNNKVGIETFQGPVYGQNDAHRPEISRDIDYVKNGEDTSESRGELDQSGGGNWRQSDGKRNWGDQAVQGNWKSVSGASIGDRDGSWTTNGGRNEGLSTGREYGRGVKGNNWQSTDVYVSGRKARSWDPYNGGLEKRWGAKLHGPAGESWVSLEKVAPGSQNTTIESGEFGTDQQSGKWATSSDENLDGSREYSGDSHEKVNFQAEQQNRNWESGRGDNIANLKKLEEYVDVPQKIDQMRRWESRNEHTNEWCNGEQRRNDVEDIEYIPGGKNWRITDKPPEMIGSANEPEKIVKNWWIRANVKDNGQKWDKTKPIERWNNVQHVKDTPHIYGGWRTLSNYFDHHRDSNSRNGQRKWTR